MAAIVIVGAQWGDEGKGKATDILGGRVDYVVKPNGGNNAGHTVVVGGEKYELKLLPAGILSENATPVLGNGVVINLEALFNEVDGLTARGANAERLRISANAHLVAPYHQTLDRVQERFLGKRAIGTTGRGIGPTYSDKVARVGLRVQDVFDESILRQKIESALDVKNQMLVKMYNRKAIDPEQVVEHFLSYRDRLEPMVIDAELELNRALDAGKHVLMEGGQATMLDVDHGTYPFVTSSNPTTGGACTGSGIGPTRITAALGIIKAYTTRVGAGPFPTELHDKWGEYLQTTGGEIGVNTGRKRRCGWYDAVIARYATRVNGFTDYFLTKLDGSPASARSPSAWPTTLTARATTRCRSPSPSSTTPSPSTRRCPRGTRTSPSAARSRTCRKRHRTTSSGWRSCLGAASPTSASAQVATRPSCGTTYSTRK